MIVPTAHHLEVMYYPRVNESVRTLVRVANAFGVSVASLLEESNTKASLS